VPAPDPKNGKALYDNAPAGVGMACVTCHSAPNKRNSNVQLGANSSSTIASAIQNGTGGMDMFKGAFSDAQLQDIAAYIAADIATPGF
jgi:mono/diheme cytochrome c family protein